MGQRHCDLFSFTKLKKRLLASGTMELSVVSGSMLPLIPIGATISIAAIQGELKSHDIVVFWDGEKLISHYIWKKSAFRSDGQPLWITRSLQDSESNDLPVKEVHILGMITNFRISTLQKLKSLIRAWIKGRL